MLGMLRRNRCATTREQLSAFLDGRLSPKERQSVEGHLALCETCRQELSQLRATVELLHGLPRALPRRSFTLSEDQVTAPSPVGWWQPALRSATAVAVMLLAVVLVGDFLQAPPAATTLQKGVAFDAAREVTAVADQSKLRAAAPAPAAAPEAAPRAPALPPAATPQAASAAAPQATPSPLPKQREAVEARPPEAAGALPFREVEIGLMVLALALGVVTLMHWRLSR